MAWLQNLADKAEDFLNKIDQNAANVLNESLSSKNLELLNRSPSSITTAAECGVKESFIPNQPTAQILHERGGPSNSSIQSIKSIEKNLDNVSVASEKSYLSEPEEDGIYIDLSPGKEKMIYDSDITQEISSSDTQLLSLKSLGFDSVHFSDDIQTNYEEKMSKLALENHSLNKQMLNLQHLYSEMQNENCLLQSQIDRANEFVAIAQNEMEQYKTRAQRILQEREKQILQGNSDLLQNLPDGNMLTNYNEELKKELEFVQERNKEISEKVTVLNHEIAILQQQYVSTQNNNQHSINNLQDSLTNEKRIRMNAEEECRIKAKELQSALLELSQHQTNFKSAALELQEIKKQLKDSPNLKSHTDVESRLQTLTQTLMTKQNALETITTERNALKIQLEKLENEYHTVLLQNQRNEVIISNVNDTDDAKSQVPRLMVISPFDAGVTRRVKHAYSTLDAVSIRTGVFLRRYPLARIFVFCYMVLLHIWMLIILYTYVP